MNSHNDTELFKAGEASEDVKNSIQIRARKHECQNLYSVYWHCRAGWDETLKKQMGIKTTRRAGALRRARLPPVFASCVLMRPTNSAIIRLIVPFLVLL
jgi:hypothetical protein